MKITQQDEVVEIGWTQGRGCFGEVAREGLSEVM